MIYKKFKDGDKEGEMVLVKLENEEQKREVTEKKNKLRGRKTNGRLDVEGKKDEMEVRRNS